METRDIHHRRIAWLAAALILGASATAHAAPLTHYRDVSAGVWYESAAAALLDSGALDRNEQNLRPSALATRAELVKLLVRVHDEPLIYPAVQGFNDVAKSSWYFPYFEAAAKAGWVRGDRDCYRRTRPCTARPASGVNRAEAAALLVRAFQPEHTGAAPVFPDNPQSAWYYLVIQTAADHCILQGDDMTGRVRPASLMNRAEMVAMFHRASQNLAYGTDCGPRADHISDVTALSSTRVRITFNVDLNRTRAQDESRYTLLRSAGGGGIGITNATLTGNRTVELDLRSDLNANTSYSLTAMNLLTTDGVAFTDSATFRFPMEEDARIVDTVALSPTRLRLTFNVDLNRARAEDETRYTVVRNDGGGGTDVRTTTLLSPRAVELELRDPLTSNVSYRLTAANLLTAAGNTFTDSSSFTFVVAVTPAITGVTAPDAKTVRVTFNLDLDAARAEDASRYAVRGTEGDRRIRSVIQMNDRSVELRLDDALRNQSIYTLAVTGMRSRDGTVFTDSRAFTFSTGAVLLDATLSGAQEVPPVSTTASGTGSFTLDAAGLRYDISISVPFLSGPVTAAHFHIAAAGSNGPVAMPITFTGNHATGTWANLTAEQRDAILSGNVYVNVHTATHPDGEIRGQLRVR